MNRVILLIVFSLVVSRLVAYEHVSDYSFVGLSSCTNYPGYSYVTPQLHKQQGKLFNDIILLSVLRNIELAAIRHDDTQYMKDVKRLRYLLAFMSLDNHLGPLERHEAFREVCYMFLRIIHAGTGRGDDIKTLFPDDFLGTRISFQTKRHQTFLKMTFLAGKIMQYRKSSNGRLPPDLNACLSVTQGDMLDAWGRKIEYEVLGTTWQLYSHGPRNEAKFYDFDSYVPALDLGCGTIDTLGVYLSQSFTLRREQLFAHRSIEIWVKGEKRMCFLDSRNMLHDSQMGVRRMEGLYAKVPRVPLDRELSKQIAETIFKERFGYTIDVRKTLSATETPHSFIVQCVHGKGVGKSLVLEIGKDDGAIIRCMQEPVER